MFGAFVLFTLLWYVTDFVCALQSNFSRIYLFNYSRHPCVHRNDDVFLSSSLIQCNGRLIWIKRSWFRLLTRARVVATRCKDFLANFCLRPRPSCTRFIYINKMLSLCTFCFFFIQLELLLKVEFFSKSCYFNVENFVLYVLRIFISIEMRFSHLGSSLKQAFLI